VASPAGDVGAGEALAELIYRYGEARALVRGTQKLVTLRDGDERRRLIFDLATDPAETHPASADGAVGTALSAELERRLAAAGRDRSQGSEATTDDDVKARLRDLGYAK
jgi:hypothetical protein